MSMAEKSRYVDQLRENVPSELLDRPQWVLYRLMQRDDKLTKIPFDPNVNSGGNASASATDPDTWASFDDAAKAYEHGDYAGLGYVFSQADPYTGVDFDKCVQDGESNEQVKEWVSGLDSYTEYSQSGTGIHTIVKAAKPGDRCKNTKLGVEMYDQGRFFVFTGEHVAETPKSINKRHEALKTMYAEVFPRQTHSNTDGADKTARSVNLDDDELLKKMFASKKGAEIEALWQGNTSKYASLSEADLALCSHLAFWTRRDKERMDKMFRNSGLHRNKWERKDYRNRTLDKAITGTDETYHPREDKHVGGDSTGTSDQQSTGDLPAHAESENAIRNRFSVGLTAAEFASRKRTTEWLIRDVLYAKALAFIVAAPFSGKTYVLLNLVFAACLGRQFANRFDMPKPLTVLYCTEEGLAGLGNRLRAAAASFDVTLEELGAKLVILEIMPRLFERFDDPKDLHDFIDGVKEIQEKRGISFDLIVFDPLQAVEEGSDENSGKERGIVNSNLTKIRQELDCAIWMAAHPSKGGKKVSVRGHSLFTGSADTIVEIKKNGKGVNATNKLSCSKLKEGQVWGDLQFNFVEYRVDDDMTAYIEWGKPGKRAKASKAKTIKERIIRYLRKNSDSRLEVNKIADSLGIESPRKLYRPLNDLAGDGQVKKETRDEKKPHNPADNPYVYSYIPQ